MAVHATEAELRRALNNGEIVPYFQALVQVRSGVVCGFEVLARWLHPVRGMLAPGYFITLAERAGLIGALTETILLQAFAAALHRNLELSVNISPVQLRDPSLPEQIRRAAEQGAFPLNHLTIEITESSLVDNLELASSIASELKRMGVKLALDDFGTGYSSLRHLQALPFDEIKSGSQLRQFDDL
jgi:EAL domain-containing protein (putative c-di-GMP-specific phosphodiesterase class I)